VLHALVAAGVVVWNDPRAIERCVDKSMTSLLIARAGVPTPDTFVVSTREAAAEVVRREATPSRPLVLKPLFGSQGKGLRLVTWPEELPDVEDVARVYYLQRFVRRRTEGWRDYRVFVCDGRVVAAMAREGDGWITNVHQGGRPTAWAMPAEAASLALRATQAVDVSYSGVDLIEGEDGRFLVLEVNSMPSWSGLQSIADVDVTEAVVRGFLKAVYAAHRPAMVAAS